MAKSNAELQKEKRAKEKALLDRIGAEKRTLIVSKALDEALQVLGERHDFEEWQETVSTLLINLAKATAYESGKFATMSRPKFIVSELRLRQLKDFAKSEAAQHDE